MIATRLCARPPTFAATPLPLVAVAPLGAATVCGASRLGRFPPAGHYARHNGTVYHMRGAAAVLRSLGLMAMGGDRLISRYDWLYSWTHS